MALTCPCCRREFLQYQARDPRDVTSPGRLLGVYCRKCHTEWLKEDLLLDAGSEDNVSVQYEGVSLRRRTGCASKKNRVGLQRVEWATLVPGDHITWYRGYGIMHHCIVVDVNTEDGSIEIVEFTSSKCTCTGCGCVSCCGSIGAEDDGVCCNCCRILERTILSREEITCWTATCKGLPYRVLYSPEELRANPTELVLARAYALKHSLGFYWCGYSLLQNNCEHFSTFCKTGCAKSQQAAVLCIAILRAVVAGLRSPLAFMFFKILALFAGEAVENFMMDFSDPRYDWVGPVIAISINFLVFLIELCVVCTRKRHGYKDCRHDSCHWLMEFLAASCLIFVFGIYGERLGRYLAMKTVEAWRKKTIQLACAVTAGFLGNLLGLWIGKSFNQTLCNCIIYTGCCDCCSSCCQCCDRHGYDVENALPVQHVPLLSET